MENTKKILDGLYRLKSDLKIMYLGRLKTRYDASVETLDEAIECVELLRAYENRPNDKYWYQKGKSDAIDEFVVLAESEWSASHMGFGIHDLKRIANKLKEQKNSLNL